MAHGWPAAYFCLSHEPRMVFMVCLVGFFTLPCFIYYTELGKSLKERNEYFVTHENYMKSSFGIYK